MADGRLKEAQFSISEASLLSPNSYLVLLQRGRLAELRGEVDEAKTLYDEALAIHPTGERILVHMVSPKTLPNDITLSHTSCLDTLFFVKLPLTTLMHKHIYNALLGFIKLQ